jgi:hypothetical protein
MTLHRAVKAFSPLHNPTPFYLPLGLPRVAVLDDLAPDDLAQALEVLIQLRVRRLQSVVVGC